MSKGLPFGWQPYDPLKYEITKKLTNSIMLAKQWSKHGDRRFCIEMRLFQINFNE